MSQFVLFTSKENNPAFSNVSHHSFLKKYAEILFKNMDIENVYTIINCDDWCVEAQKELISGKPFSQTQLFRYMECLKEEEIFFWYGSECDNLDKIHHFDALISQIQQSLLEASGEIYLHYKKVDL